MGFAAFDCVLLAMWNFFLEPLVFCVMKHSMRFVAVLVGTTLAVPLLADAQATHPIPLDAALRYFREAQSLCQADHGQLWGVSLCGPIMFVDPSSRFLVANQQDSESILKPEGGVYVGTLPVEQNIANSAVDWAGAKWTQMMWPLPEDSQQRKTLMAHEMFHRIQGKLGLPAVPSGDNAQLDTLDGRYCLQLEWRALARALESDTDSERREAAADALLFRAERYRLFPDAETQEKALEMNEGLAEYTGVRVGNSTPAEQIKMALSDIARQKDTSTFVRSFAYATGPAYGLLLDRYAPGWHAELNSGKGFGDLLNTSLAITLPTDLSQAAAQRAQLYDGAALHAAEAERDRKKQQLLALYRARFVEGPALTLPLRNMHVQFDPRNLHPLDSAGTVYPTMRITDDWGILEVTNGALLKPDWSAVIVAAPATNAGSNLKGDGWTLELRSGWKIISGTRNGDWILVSGK